MSFWGVQAQRLFPKVIDGRGTLVANDAKYAEQFLLHTTSTQLVRL